ncbi:hypothetical protein [Vannielia litorea]|uniref:Uncharacterized protein n=1 Tax=Vannielia litorea TaxID=1217970 RepID=A0A1N6G9E8_9RHOB|nr:hypothetical protein [Vannielia litorea]SIO04128.1 hypothetical protein SAMN05444002_2306 [Vannielia litorea]
MKGAALFAGGAVLGAALGAGGAWLYGALSGLAALGAALSGAQGSAAVAGPAQFDAPVMVLQRQYLARGAEGISLILTESATGGEAVFVADAAGLSGHVDSEVMSTGQSVAAVAFSLGGALANWRTYALLVQEGEVVDKVTCWRCDVRLPDFRGADVAALVAQGRAIRPEHRTFDSEEAFEAALAAARTDGGVIVDRKAQFGQSGGEGATFWVLNTWVMP